MTQTATISFEGLYAGLRLGERARKWALAFDSTAAFSEPHDTLATPGDLRRVCDYLGVCEATAEAFERTRVAYDREPLWWRLVCHLAQRFIVDGVAGIDAGMPPDAAGEPGRMLYAMVYAGLLPHAQRLHRARAVPPEVTRQSLGDIRRKLIAYREKTGRFGMDNVRFPAVSFSGQLFELGRLQFVPAVFRDPFVILRSGDAMQLVALGGVQVRADGMFADADGVADPRAWSTTFEIGDHEIVGHAVAEHGAIDPRPRAFDRSRWSIATQPGSPVLGVHIPDGPGLTPSACAEAFAEAGRFFPRHFADRHVEVFTCHSWLMDPQLSDAMPADSNIVQFQQGFCRYPIAGANDQQVVERVLMNQPDAEPETRLQRIVQDHRRRGGHWRTSAGARFVPERGELLRSERP